MTSLSAISLKLDNSFLIINSILTLFSASFLARELVIELVTFKSVSYQSACEPVVFVEKVVWLLLRRFPTSEPVSL